VCHAHQIKSADDLLFVIDGFAIVSEKYFALGYKAKHIKALQRSLVNDSTPSNHRKAVFMRSCALDEIQHYDARPINIAAHYAFIFNAVSWKNCTV
jgi:hypothetical protein